MAGTSVRRLTLVFFAGYLARAIIRPVRWAVTRARRPAAGNPRDPGDRAPEDRSATGAPSGWRHVATLLGQGATPPVLAAAVTEEAGRFPGVGAATMVRYGPDGSVTVLGAWNHPTVAGTVTPHVSLALRDLGALVARNGHAVRMDSQPDAVGPVAPALRECGVHSAVGTAITVKGRPWGALVVFSMRDPLPPDTESRLADFIDPVVTAVATTVDLIASRARIVVATDQSRRRFERDLHGGPQQRLVSLALSVRTAEAAVPAQLPGLRAQLSAVAEGLVSMSDDLREISHAIYPAVLSDSGLKPALKTLARRCPVRVVLDAPADLRLPPAVEMTAYCVVAEALANAATHARASVVHVAVVLAARLRVSVHDDGIGGADPARGSGLIGLIDRVEAMGGTITITSPVGHGTSLQVEMPTRPD